MKEKYPLTQTQFKYFNYIKNYIHQYKMAPSYRDIMRGLNIKTTSAVHLVMDNLEKRGWIKRLPGSWRSIIIVE